MTSPVVEMHKVRKVVEVRPQRTAASDGPDSPSERSDEARTVAGGG